MPLIHTCSHPFQLVVVHAIYGRAALSAHESDADERDDGGADGDDTNEGARAGCAVDGVWVDTSQVRISLHSERIGVLMYLEQRAESHEKAVG